MWNWYVARMLHFFFIFYFEKSWFFLWNLPIFKCWSLKKQKRKCSVSKIKQRPWTQSLWHLLCSLGSKAEQNECAMVGSFQSCGRDEEGSSRGGALLCGRLCPKLCGLLHWTLLPLSSRHWQKVQWCFLFCRCGGRPQKAELGFELRSALWALKHQAIVSSPWFGGVAQQEAKWISVRDLGLDFTVAPLPVRRGPLSEDILSLQISPYQVEIIPPAQFTSQSVGKD